MVSSGAGWVGTVWTKYRPMIQFFLISNGRAVSVKQIHQEVVNLAPSLFFTKSYRKSYIDAWERQKSNYNAM